MVFSSDYPNKPNIKTVLLDGLYLLGPEAEEEIVRAKTRVLNNEFENAIITMPANRLPKEKPGDGPTLVNLPHKVGTDSDTVIRTAKKKFLGVSYIEASILKSRDLGIGGVVARFKTWRGRLWGILPTGPYISRKVVL